MSIDVCGLEKNWTFAGLLLTSQDICQMSVRCLHLHRRLLDIHGHCERSARHTVDISGRGETLVQVACIKNGPHSVPLRPRFCLPSAALLLLCFFVAARVALVAVTCAARPSTNYSRWGGGRTCHAEVLHAHSATKDIHNTRIVTQAAEYVVGNSRRCGTHHRHVIGVLIFTTLCVLLLPVRQCWGWAGVAVSGSQD